MARAVTLPRAEPWALPLRAYLELTKPGITLFIGVSAGAGYVAAQEGGSDTAGLAAALAATMLMSGGAAAQNHVAERESDARMRRTAGRPLPSGALPVRHAAQFGWTLSALGLLLALAALPRPAALFLVLSHISYVHLYTPLKRRTPFCTLAGALPGAFPVLAGWAASGRPLALPGLALASVLYMWQIPHFLAIGWLAREDYAQAGCPMLGVLDESGRMSARVSFSYTLAMIAAAAIVATTTPTGPLFASVAALSSGAYAACAWSFVRHPARAPARRLFFSSLVVLPVLLGALVADLVV
jgi:protoheme IX farnesyltransferase